MRTETRCRMSPAAGEERVCGTDATAGNPTRQNLVDGASSDEKPVARPAPGFCSCAGVPVPERVRSPPSADRVNVTANEGARRRVIKSH